MRRVVVTGLGCVSPLGNNLSSTWSALIDGKCGIKNLDESFKFLPSLVGGVVKVGTGEDEFNIDNVVGKEGKTQSCKFIAFAIAAADEAIKDSGWVAKSVEEEERAGVCIGSGIGSLQDIVQSALLANSGEKGYRKISPFFIPRILVNMAGGHVSIKHKLKGPNHAASTACATGSHAISDAYRFIKYGDADVMVAGGSESSIDHLSVAGFSRLRALSTSFNETPQKSSRPFDKDRDGFVIGEGSGVVVLEELEHALKRGAKIYCEIGGVGYSGDANHITSPSNDGDGAYRCMKMAIKNANVDLKDIKYVNAHATSTPLGDVIEGRAIQRIFGEREACSVFVSSTKGAIGHLLGAAGAIESIFTIKAIEENTLPPTINLDNVDDQLKGLKLIPNKAIRTEVLACLSNSFGFGGTNSSILFKKFIH